MRIVLFLPVLLLLAADASASVCDVAVIGGGSAGVAAAWSAARRGADTVLVEKSPLLGGTSTVGGVNAWEPVCGARGLSEMLYRRLEAEGKAGVYRFVHHVSWTKSGEKAFPGALLEIENGVPYSATLRRHGPGMKDEKWFRENCRGVIFDAEAMAREMRSALEATGHCRILTSTEFVSLEKNAGRVVRLKLSNGETLEPKVVVDACGAVAKAAGCELMRSDKPNGATLVYRVKRGVDAASGAVEPCWWAENYPLAFCMKLPNGEIAVNMLPTMSGEEARRLGAEAAYAECRRRAAAHWGWMRQRWPEFAGWTIAGFSPVLAERDTFRVRGEHVLTGEEVYGGIRPADEIASADHALDAHGGEGFGGELSQPYGISYRCLVASGVDNLLLAGRISSFDARAASSCRLSRTMMKLGEAAGAAAAVSALENVGPRDVAVGAIRDVFVSPQGDDGACGTKTKPVATLRRALELAAGCYGAKIHVARGFYGLDSTLRLTSEHSGVSVVAEAGGECIISGGRRLDGWKVREDGFWSLKVDPSWRFSQLFINDRRCLRPYLPRRGYYRVAEKFPVPPGVRPKSFYCHEGDIRSDMRNFKRIEFCSFQNWVMSRVPLAAFDPKTRLVTLAGGVHRPGQCELTSEHWYRLDNVRDALGEVPGEWYLEEDGTVLYVPRKGEDPARCTAVAPVLGRLLEIDGASDVTFDGLTFAHSGWNVPERGHPACQAESRTVPWAVSATNSRNVKFERCIFRHTGAGALEFGGASRNCRAVKCEFFDIGGGGVHVGPEWDGSNPGDNSTDFARMPASRYTWDCEVTDCFIACGGRSHPSAVGVWVTHAPRTRVIGNTVADFYYSGISVGWNWALGTNSTWSNEIAFNRVARIGRGVLSDLGGIYLLGAQPGTTVHDNYIHDVSRSRYGAWGVYFDSGSSYMTVSNNLMRNCTDGGWYLARLSAGNSVIGNFIDAQGDYQLCPMPRRSESAASVFERNFIKWTRGELLPQIPGRDSVAFADNTVYTDFNEALPEGFERSRDFAAFDAAAAKITSASGCSFRPRTLALPHPPEVFPPAPPKLQVEVADGDFENLAVGSSWPGWTVYAASASQVAVGDRRAASGRRSLLFSNAGQKGYRPFIESTVCRTGRRLHVEFDLFAEKGACPRFEMRDSDAYVLASGPVLEIDERGRFRARDGGDLGEAVFGRWIHVKLSCNLGGRASYDLSIDVPGEDSPRVWRGLKMHPRFAALGWMGFLSLSSGNETFSIDNFRLSGPEGPSKR